jgi:ketosteroid isomerase-like protein
MRIQLTLLLVLFFTLLLSGQAEEMENSKIEEEIRKLDLLEAQAMQERNLEKLDGLLADNFLVNSPRNEIVDGKKAVEDLVRNGIVNYSSFEREIESVQIHDGIAIVMGQETIKPIGKAPGAGQVLRRRYTNIWLNKNGRWLLSARHASVICQQ